jgi:hypothetical protein
MTNEHCTSDDTLDDDDETVEHEIRFGLSEEFDETT